MSVSLLTASLVAAAALVAALYLPHLRVGLNLADEGYLWLGASAVLRGAVPIRDFRAYDPGRYVWAAAWMRLLGDDLHAVRIASLAARLLALTLGIAAARLAAGAWVPALATGVLLAAWMHPPYKQIDALASMAAVLAAAWLGASPDPAALVAAGATAGLLALVGMNHALYAVGGTSLLVALLLLAGRLPATSAALLWYLAGLAAGASPYVLMIAGVRGLARAYRVRKLAPLLRRGTTNLSLPIPWPWRPPTPAVVHHPPSTLAVVRWAFALLAPILVAGLVLLPCFAGDHPGRWAVVGSTAVGLGYAHHAMSRADHPHLAPGAGPLLVALGAGLGLLPYGWAIVAALAALSLRTVYLPFEGLGRWPAPGELVPFEAGRTALRLPADQAGWLGRVRAVVEEHSRPGDPVAILPFLVTLYPLLDRRPAVYDVFCVYPATAEEEAEMIAQLRTSGARLALIDDHPLDGREDLRFRRTHPRVWAHLHQEFELLAVADLGPNQRVFRQRSDPGAAPSPAP